MPKKLEVKKQVFDAVLRKMIGSRPTPLSKIETGPKKPAKIIAANSSQLKPGKA